MLRFKSSSICLMVLLIVLTVGCQTAASPTPTSVYTNVPTLRPTAIPSLTATKTPPATARATSSPSPTPTHTPTPMPLSNWEVIGPEGGRVNLLAIDPTTPTTLYVVSAGDLFKSIDGAASWNKVPVDWWVSALLVDPVTPGLLYAGSAKGALYRSTDGAQSWQSTGTGLSDDIILDLAIDPLTPGTLYMATSKAVLKSVDGGESWRESWPSGLSPDNYVDSDFTAVRHDLIIDPVTPATVYAISDRDAWKSMDGGESWNRASEIGRGLSGLPDPDEYKALAIAPTTPPTVYLAITRYCQMEDGPYFCDGVYKSMDGGVTWHEVDAGLGLDVRERSYCSEEGRLCYVGVTNLVVDPRTPTTVYAGTEDSVFKSVDGGETWSNINAGLVGEETHGITALAIDLSDPNIVYVGTRDVGIYKSTNGGAAWGAASSGLQKRSITSVTNTPTTLYAADVGGVVLKSIDSGRSWEATGPGFPKSEFVHLTVAPTDPSILYAVVTTGGYYRPTTRDEWFGNSDLYRSTDGGLSWDKLDLPDKTPKMTVTVDPLTPTTLYICIASIDQYLMYRSVDTGASWVYVWGSEPQATEAVSQSTLYLETQSEIYKSMDGGANWSMTHSDPDSTYMAVTSDPSSPDRLYWATNSFDAHGNRRHGGILFGSTDGGESWNRIGTLDTYIWDIAVDPLVPSRLLLASPWGILVLPLDE